MASTSIKNRIRKAQTKTHAGDSLGIVAKAIWRKAYYDELTEEEKDAYCNYRGYDRKAMEDVETMIKGNLHFVITKKPKPPTQKELQERIEEVQEYILNCKGIEAGKEK